MCVCLLGRWLAWTCDAIDFFSVSLSVPLLQKQFNKDKASTIVRCPLLARSPFMPHPRMNCLLLMLAFRYSDSGHHADASLPVIWRRKCFLVTCFSCYAPRTMPCFVRPSSAASVISGYGSRQPFSPNKRPSSSRMCVSRSMLMLLYPCRSSLASCLIASGGNGPW